MDTKADTENPKRLIAIVYAMRADLSYLGVEQLITEAGLHVETNVHTFTADAVLITEGQERLKEEIREKFPTLAPEDRDQFMARFRKKMGELRLKGELEKLRKSIWEKLTKQEKRIYSAIREHPLAKGEDYCKVLRDGEVSPRSGWCKKGCPRDYVKARKDDHWRQRINDEKAKLFNKI